MFSLSGFNIIVIDFPQAYQLRSALAAAGAIVHTVTPAGALTLARNRRIDAAFVGFGVGGDTRRLCEQLNDLGIRQIVLTAGGSERSEQEFAMLPDLVRGVSRVATDWADVAEH